MTAMESTAQPAHAKPRSPSVFVVLMSACLVAPGWIQATIELTTTGRIEALAGLLDLAAARTSRQDFENSLESRAELTRWASRHYAPAADGLLERGNARVVFGNDGWLFFREAVDYLTGPAIDTSGAPELGTAMSVIIDFHRQLEAAGVDLLVVPVPVKATLHPERLWSKTDPSALPNNPGFGQFVATLQQAGVAVIDLAPAWLAAKQQGASLFLPRDTHWTPIAMSIAADTVAARAQQRPAWADLEAQARPFDTRQVTFSGRGDLYDMLAYAPWQRKLRPMRLDLSQVIANRFGQGPRWRESPVLLLGDSLTNVFSSSELAMGQRAGFAEQLAARLKMPIDVIAMPAGGASRSRQALALRAAPLAGKRLVIWQFTQRDLLFAADGWVQTPLDTSPASTETPDRVDAQYEVLAALAKTTRLPEKLDYADCLIVSRYRKVDGDLPGPPRPIDVVQWGVRNWIPTTAAGYRVNALHRLVIRRLPPEIDLERTCWIDDVGLESRPWWVVEIEPQ